MRANERNIILIVAGVVLAAAFWFLILSPKRDKVTQLNGQVSELQQSVDAEQQRAEFGKQAKDQFASNYSKIVLLGKAAPEDSDSASFLVQLNSLAQKNKVDFRELALQPGDAQAAVAAAQPGVAQAPPSTSQPSATAPAAGAGETASDTGDTQPTTPSATAAATEATASTLAIGAGVGPAGLNTLKYDLIFRGEFFDIAAFMSSVDELVSSSGGKVVVDGRLSTVDGFTLAPTQGKGWPSLDVSMVVTTFTTPPGQGTTAGASPAGPAPAPSGDEPQLAASQGATP